MRSIPLLDPSGLVVNVIVLADGADYAPPDGLTLGAVGGHIGDRFDGTRYVRPPARPRPAPPGLAPAGGAAPPDLAALQAQIAALQAQITEMSQHVLVHASLQEIAPDAT
jgi:hypothetical protein